MTNEETGCSNKAPVYLSGLETCPLDIIGVPNVFSPNGDDNNDRFELFPTPSIDEIISFRVFDRWGALIFETTNINESWDGTYDGTPEPSGVYIYMIEFPCEVDGSIVVKSGDITLLR